MSAGALLSAPISLTVSSSGGQSRFDLQQRWVDSAKRLAGDCTKQCVDCVRMLTECLHYPHYLQSPACASRWACCGARPAETAS